MLGRSDVGYNTHIFENAEGYNIPTVRILRDCVRGAAACKVWSLEIAQQCGPGRGISGSGSRSPIVPLK